MLRLVEVIAYPAVVPRPVHGVDLGIEDDHGEVPHQNRQRGQDGFVEVNRGGRIDDPARQVIAEQHLGPDHDAGHGHDHRAPHQRPVLHLFGVVEALELRLVRAQAQVVEQRVLDICDVLPLGQQINGKLAAFPGGGDVPGMINADQDQNDAGDPVQHAAQSLTEEQHSEPGFRVLQRKAGGHQQEEADQQGEVLHALVEAHAHDDSGATREVRVSIANVDQFALHDHRVMQKHAADGGEDHQQVEAADQGDGLAADIGGVRVQMHLAGREISVGAGMALAAGLDEMRRVDGRVWIARRQDVVHPVTTGAVGRDLRSAGGGQPVIAGQIARLAAAYDSELPRHFHVLVALGAGVGCQIFRRNRRGWVLGVLDHVRAVTVGTDRRMQVALGDRLPVNALHELRALRLVTLGAGGGNAALVDGRFGIGNAPHVVGAMAVAANRGLLVAGGHQLGVNAVLIGSERLSGLTRLLHHRLPAMAAAAGGRDVLVAYLGSWVAGGKNFMNVAMAVDATRGLLVAGRARLGMQPVIVRLLLIRMACGAGWLGGQAFMRKRSDILMAIGAKEHAAVNGILEWLLLHLQTHLLAVFLPGQRGVVMACQAIRIGELLHLLRLLGLG